MNDTGIYYIATGEQFVQEAEVSAKSIRSVMPDIPIAIATDVETDFDFDYVIDIEDPIYGFSDQILNLHKSPFNRTIHFDTDIYLESDISEMFELLTQFDIAAAINHNREVYNPAGVPDSFPEYNTGVIVYRNDKNFKNFVRSWENNYDDLGIGENTQNQPSFRKTLYESNLRIATLTPEYNCMLRYPGHIRNDVKIAHSRLLNIQTPGADKSVNVSKGIESLNKYNGHRLFTPDGDSGVSVVYGRVPKDALLLKRVMNSIRINGLIQTIRLGIYFLLKQLREKIN